ncbi:hypothetical protein NRB_15810 [Novosphingobium sp. 11B]
MTERQKFTAFSSLALAAVSASLVLYPSVVGLAKLPLVHLWMMWVYLACAFCAFLLLSFIYYISTFTTEGLPHRRAGIASLFTVTSLVSFGAFLTINLWQDQSAKPQILGLTASAYTAAPGDIVALTGESANESGHPVSWSWCTRAPAVKNVRPAPVCLASKLKTATWSVPENAVQGVYKIEAKVLDDALSSSPQFMEIKIWPTK